MPAKNFVENSCFPPDAFIFCPIRFVFLALPILRGTFPKLFRSPQHDGRQQGTTFFIAGFAWMGVMFVTTTGNNRGQLSLEQGIR